MVKVTYGWDAMSKHEFVYKECIFASWIKLKVLLVLILDDTDIIFEPNTSLCHIYIYACSCSHLLCCLIV